MPDSCQISVIGSFVRIDPGSFSNSDNNTSPPFFRNDRGNPSEPAALSFPKTYLADDLHFCWRIDLTIILLVGKGGKFTVAVDQLDFT